MIYACAASNNRAVNKHIIISVLSGRINPGGMQMKRKINVKSSRIHSRRANEFVKNPCEEEPEGSEQEQSPQKQAFDGESGSILTCHNDKIIHCLTIIPLLMSVEEDDGIDGLLILLNTVGGDVEAGLAIAEVISGMKKPSVSIVLGGGHSIGIPLAVAAKKSFIAKSASMTVHPVRTTGLTLGVPQTFEYFRRMQDRITNFVVENSAITKERYNELVLNTGELVTDVGTILEGEDAVAEGLIDEIGTVSDAVEALYGMINSNT